MAPVFLFVWEMVRAGHHLYNMLWRAKKERGFFYSILLCFSVVPWGKLCYNVCN